MSNERSKFYIIDRRKSGGKSSPNRDRFLRRQQAAIKAAVRSAISTRNITNMDEDGVDVTINRDTISEPSFRNNYRTGVRHGVNVGNTKYQTGDFVRKPMSNQQQEGQGGSDGGDGEDDFTFHISKDEFLDYFFADLALPNQVKESIADSDEYKWVRSGYTSEGTPANLDLIGTMRSALGRRLALMDFEESEELLVLQMEYERLLSVSSPSAKQSDRIAELTRLIAAEKELQTDSEDVPFLDKVDLRYRTHSKQITPITNAVMFCVMDVSGSMGELEKNLSKRFFTLLYLFLKRNYKKLDIRFIRHHHIAKEVDEQEFFYSRDSGGTVVSGAMDLVHDIITSDYNDGTRNIYIAQASDGDNFTSDTDNLISTVREKILPLVQHMSYMEVGGHYPDGVDSYLMGPYKSIASTVSHLDLAIVKDASQIWPAFRELFAKRK